MRVKRRRLLALAGLGASLSLAGCTVGYAGDRRRGSADETAVSLPVVVAGRRGSAVAFDRRVEGRTLTFERADPGSVRGGGSRWRVETGRAVDGPLEGTRLQRVNAHPPLFWFAWLDFHPGTTVWGRD